MKSVIFFSYAIAMNLASANAFASDSCQLLNIVDTVKISTVIKNTAHDFKGDNDELSLYYASSSKPVTKGHKIDDDFADTKLGEHTAKLLGTHRAVTYAEQYKTTALPDYTIKQSELHGKYLNILLNERDSRILRESALGGVLYVLQGANPTDYLFLKSLKLSSHNGTQTFDLKNELGDQVRVTVTPHESQIIKRADLEIEIQKMKERLPAVNQRLNELSKVKVNPYSIYFNPAAVERFNLTQERTSLTQRINYYSDVLAGKISGSCQN